MMSLRQWIRDRLRDDVKHRELDEREARTDEAVEGLRAEVEKNGFGLLFQTAAEVGPRKKKKTAPPSAPPIIRPITGRHP